MSSTKEHMYGPLSLWLFLSFKTVCLFRCDKKAHKNRTGTTFETSPTTSQGFYSVTKFLDPILRQSRGPGKKSQLDNPQCYYIISLFSFHLISSPQDFTLTNDTRQKFWQAHSEGLRPHFRLSLSSARGKVSTVTRGTYYLLPPAPSPSRRPRDYIFHFKCV